MLYRDYGAGDTSESDESEEIVLTEHKKHSEVVDLADDDHEDDDYAAEICSVIEKYSCNPLELSTFSTGGEVQETIGVPVVRVEGVGRIAYPLCNEQAGTLLSISSQVPFGKVKETVVDVDVRRAWQIGSNLVQINQNWLNNSLPKLVEQVCAKLGIDAVKMNVRANLYKMLLYEEGGHFKKHRDTEKEPGMFGSLLIQLPAEHEGGHLVVEHEHQVQRHEFDKESGDNAFYAAFYADCEHTLEPVTKGLRLVLAFNLVRGAASTAPGANLALTPASATHRRGFEDMLVTATRAWLADNTAVQKFAVPLAHQYTHTNMSFASLKGTDVSTLSLLQNVVDPQSNEKLFRVYLALVTKTESGVSYEEEYGYDWYGRLGRYGGGGGGMDPDCGVETSYETAKWIGPEGAVDLGQLSVDFEEEVIAARGGEADVATEDIFGSEPDEEDDEGYCGTVEYWYYSAVLVFWPAQRDFELKLAASPTQAVAALESMDRASPDFTDKLARLLTFLAAGHAGTTVQAARVLSLTQTLEQVRSVLAMYHKQLLCETSQTAIVAEVRKHGWSVLGKEFTELLSSQSVAAMVVLLGRLEPLCGLQSAAAASVDEVAVPLAAWGQLLRVLVAKIVQSVSATGPTSSAYTYGYNASTLQVAMTEHEWLAVGRFVAAHCEPHDQEAVAAHAGSLLRLSTLNRLVEQLVLVAGSLVDGPFLARLRACAVRKCVDNAQEPAADVTATLNWVLGGHHVELADVLRPALKRVSATPAQFHALFALPAVLEELKLDTAMGRELEGLVQARIAALEPQCHPPAAFSWRMPASQISTGDSRVGPFLASDQTSITLKGTFSGIVQARGWAARYFSSGYGSGYGSSAGVKGVSAVAFGSGRNAGVVLTKNKSVHDEAVRRCEENAAEVRRLRKLLLLRAHSAGGDSDGGGVGSSGGVSTGAGVSVSAGDTQPVRKKGKVEPHIYVLA